MKHGGSGNVCDLWRFTPLHEGAAKGKYEIVKLLLKHGADPSKKNRDGHTAIDLVKEGDQDVLDLLRGDTALLDAAKKGNLVRVQKLLNPENLNCRDSQGRNSTPLHLAAGYNNLEVADFLLENGADVNAQDKGGLIPLHNASSYGHLDIAALLIRYNTVVNGRFLRYIPKNLILVKPKVTKYYFVLLLTIILHYYSYRQMGFYSFARSGSKRTDTVMFIAFGTWSRSGIEKSRGTNTLGFVDGRRCKMFVARCNDLQCSFLTNNK